MPVYFTPTRPMARHMAARLPYIPDWSSLRREVEMETMSEMDPWDVDLLTDWVSSFQAQGVHHA